MKKLNKLFFLVSITSFLLVNTSCTESRSRNDDGVYVIGERMFISQVDHIFLNHRQYLGRSIKLEGFFSHDTWNNANWYSVLRNAPGCCGDDGEVGFIVTWNPDSLNVPNGNERYLYPAQNVWVEATGDLREYRSQSISFLYLELSELNILDRRGADFVSR